jgi:branched-chain amino acid transport system permease protein
MLIWAIACLALNLLYGTAGAFSLGHGTFFGAAAYAGAFLYRFTDVGSFELYLLFGLSFSTLFAVVAGFVSVRSTGIYFAMLTLAVAMIAHSLVIDGAVFMLFGGLGWALYLLGEGSMYLPRLSIAGVVYPPARFAEILYWIIAFAFILSTLVLWRISASPFGQALRAIRDNATRAAFIGIPVWRYRWAAFAISGGFIGLAGGLYGELARQITPDQLHWMFSAQLLLATVLGGTRNFFGPVIGAFVFVVLDEIASQWAVGRYLAFGSLLIVVVLLFPQGITGGFAALIRRAW